MKPLTFIHKCINKIRSILIKPGDLFRYGTPSWREKYYKISSFIRFKEIKKREYKSENLNKIDFNKGFHFEDSETFESNFKLNLEEAIDFSNDKINDFLLHKKLNNNSKNYLQSVLSKNDFSPSDPIINLAMNDYFARAASSYLGIVPIIGQIQLWYSPNNGLCDEGSQFFHLDYADVKQFKVFIMLDDIDDNTGPLTFITAEDSKIIANKINYKLSNKEIRVPDNIIENLVDKNDWIKATGSKGQVLFIDTCNCMHFGSRNGTKPRRILMIQYISPFSFTLPLKYKGNTFLSDIFNNNKADFDNLTDYKKLLLGL